MHQHCNAHLLQLTALTLASTDATKFRTKRWRESLAIHTSVIKRHKQSLKRRARNIEARSKLRTLIKKIRQAIDSKNSENAADQLRAVNKASVISKGIIKNNTAQDGFPRLSRSAARISLPPNHASYYCLLPYVLTWPTASHHYLKTFP